MKTIKEPWKNVALLWRRPVPKYTIYRQMKYLLKVQIKEGLLLYNIVTSEMILLDDTESKLFERLPAEYDSAMDELIARHYLVPEDFAEEKSVLELRELIKKIEPSKGITGFTVLPTTECNARCSYCFQSDHEHITMTEKTANDVVDYITAVSNNLPIEIGWFGGEPLVANRRITQICSGLKQKGIKFRSRMVSNGYLFDKELIRTAKDEWNLISVQVTLDGTEQVYNETKAYVAPSDNPYQRVLRNIELLLNNGISVNVRLNVTDKNYPELCDLIEELAPRFGRKKGFTCYSHAVYEGVGFLPLDYADGDLVDTQTTALDNKLREKKLLGSYTVFPALRVFHCMSDNDSTRLIYPDGTIGKCENRSSKDSIGDIYNDVTKKEMEERYKVTEPRPNCYDCCFFPDCINLTVCPDAGKCSNNKVDWKKDWYSTLFEEYYYNLEKNPEKSADEISQTECQS